MDKDKLEEIWKLYEKTFKKPGIIPAGAVDLVIKKTGKMREMDSDWVDKVTSEFLGFYCGYETGREK